MKGSYLPTNHCETGTSGSVRIGGETDKNKKCEIWEIKQEK